MKKFKTGLVALALILGVSGAFVSKIHAAPKVDDPTYDWNGSGPLHSGDLDDKTVAQAQTFYGCSGAAAVCATGELNQGSGDPIATIRKN